MTTVINEVSYTVCRFSRIAYFAVSEGLLFNPLDIIARFCEQEDKQKMAELKEHYFKIVDSYVIEYDNQIYFDRNELPEQAWKNAEKVHFYMNVAGLTLLKNQFTHKWDGTQFLCVDYEPVEDDSLPHLKKLFEDKNDQSIQAYYHDFITDSLPPSNLLESAFLETPTLLTAELSVAHQIRHFNTSCSELYLYYLIARIALTFERTTIASIANGNTKVAIRENNVQKLFASMIDSLNRGHLIVSAKTAGSDTPIEPILDLTFNESIHLGKREITIVQSNRGMTRTSYYVHRKLQDVIDNPYMCEGQVAIEMVTKWLPT